MKTIDKLVVTNVWCGETIRSMCIRHNLYTKGSNDEYNSMLDLVDSFEPSIQMIYIIASDILKHSNTDMTIETLMYTINKEVIEVFYDFE